MADERRPAEPATAAEARAAESGQTARGAAAYAAKAAGLAAPDDRAAVADEVGWQLRHAAPAVRDVLRGLPPPLRPAGVLGDLIGDLHAEVTGSRTDR